MKAIVKHTTALYNALEEKSVVEVIDEEELYIYRGQVTKLYQNLNIPQTYYSEVFKQLDLQGCVVTLQRGSRNVDSVIVLLHPPDAEEFAESAPRGLTSPEEAANMVETVRLHSKLIGGIHIADALRNIEERLQRLEQAGAQDNSVHTNKQTQ